MTTNFGVVNGPMSGSVGIQNNHFGGQSADELVKLYYIETAKTCEDLTLAAVNPVENSREKTFVVDAYVPPDVWVVDDAKTDKKSANLDRESRRVPLRECLGSDDIAMQRLVLTAPSGFGKSTAVNVRVGMMADGATPWLMLRLPSLRLQSLGQGDVPVSERVERAFQKDIRDKIRRDETQSITIANAIIQRLDAAPGVILFDALDEVPQSERDEIVSCVRSFLNARARKPHKHRVLITSRPYAYTGQFERDQFKRIELAEFTPAQQDELITKWFNQEGKSPATGHAMSQQLAIARSGVSADQSGLATLMTEPMLLTYACMLAEQSAAGNAAIPLPPTRYELFDGVVSLMLETWDPKRAHGAVDAFRPLLERTPEKPSVLRMLLQRAALEELQTQASGTELPTAPANGRRPKIEQSITSNVTRERLVFWLDEAMPEDMPVRARTVIDWMAKRSGLLHATSDESGTRYVLQAQLRDFLAVCGLRATVGTDYAMVDAMLSLLRSRPEWYRPLTSMTLASLSDKPLELTRALVQILEQPVLAAQPAPPDGLPARQSDGMTSAHALLNFVIAWANAFGEAGPSCAKDAPFEAALKKLRERCLELVTAPAEGKPPIQLRAEAADALGQIGDPRFDPKRRHLPAVRLLSNENEPIPGFVRIAKGTFTMGDKREEDNPPRKIHIDDPFYIARYTTTVAQFRHFVESGGYDQTQWWDADGLLWLSGEYDKRVLDNEHLRRLRGRPPQERRAPASWAHQLQWPSCPVVSVSWFEARAYARWMDHLLRRALTDASLSKLAVQLPTEPQWERAARGAANKNGYDNRRWSWGDDEADAARYANVGRSLGRVAAVGLFEATGPGLLDMAGNVWEWMANAYRPANDERFDQAPRNHHWQRAEKMQDSEMLSLRGGSWFDQPEYASCSFRLMYPPAVWYDDLGFRLVLSPAQNET